MRIFEQAQVCLIKVTQVMFNSEIEAVWIIHEYEEFICENMAANQTNEWCNRCNHASMPEKRNRPKIVVIGLLLTSGGDFLQYSSKLDF